MSKPKPILFNTRMVKSILDDNKTMTRRVIKPQPTHEQPLSLKGSLLWWGNKQFKPPYKVGDILYVRETFAVGSVMCNTETGYEYIYQGVGAEDDVIPKEWAIRYKVGIENVKWKPSLHMREVDARIFLRVKRVRIEQLQDISIYSTYLEGIPDDEDATSDMWFASLWDSTIKPSDLNKYGWEANPYVWVIEFEKIGQPEDNFIKVFGEEYEYEV